MEVVNSGMLIRGQLRLTYGFYSIPLKPRTILYERSTVMWIISTKVHIHLYNVMCMHVYVAHVELNVKRECVAVGIK